LRQHYIFQVYSDFAMTSWTANIMFIWEIIPASCLLQYLAIYKYEKVGNLFSISFTLSFYQNYRSFLKFNAPPALQSCFSEIIKRIHDLDDTDKFIAYGVLLLPSPQSTLTPLLLLSFPALSLIVSMTTGMEMDKGSMIIFFFLYALPTVQ
ncbi:hypothetical protein PMAYCL1PPCAC_14787, partial [Pristionchus mayeri]